MQYLFLLFLPFSLFSVEIHLKPKVSQDITTKQHAFISYLKHEKNFTLNNPDDAKTLIKENEALANAYLDSSLSSHEKVRLEVAIDELLSKQMVKKVQKSIDISEDVITSYYLNNRNDFKLEPLLAIEIYEFKNYNEASKLYMYTQKHQSDEIKTYIDAAKASKKDLKRRLNQLHPSIASLIKKQEQKSGYFLPPLYLKDKFIVIYIRAFDDSAKYIPLRQSKTKIKNILWEKTYLKKRKELLKKYGTK